MNDYLNRKTHEEVLPNLHKLLKESMEGYRITDVEITTEDDRPDSAIKSIELTLYNDLFEDTNIVSFKIGDGLGVKYGFSIKGKYLGSGLPQDLI